MDKLRILKLHRVIFKILLYISIVPLIFLELLLLWGLKIINVALRSALSVFANLASGSACSVSHLLRSEKALLWAGK